MRLDKSSSSSASSSSAHHQHHQTPPGAGSSSSTSGGGEALPSHQPAGTPSKAAAHPQKSAHHIQGEGHYTDNADQNEQVRLLNRLANAEGSSQVRDSQSKRWSLIFSPVCSQKDVFAGRGGGDNLEKKKKKKLSTEEDLSALPYVHLCTCWAFNADAEVKL